MSYKYTEETCITAIAALYESGDLSKLYNMPFVTWSGVTSDTKREYQEVFARYIWERLVDGTLPMIAHCNVKEYCTHERFDRRTKILDNEEAVQRDFYEKRRTLDPMYGEPLWYELQTNGEGQGKGIDLVYYNGQTEEINIFELKYKNKNEGLLRALLEIQTYYQRVDWYAAVRDFRRKGLIGNTHISKINKYILVDAGSVKIEEKIREMEKNGEGYVKKLLREFNISIVRY